VWTIRLLEKFGGQSRLIVFLRGSILDVMVSEAVPVLLLLLLLLLEGELADLE
jgi:hypothetical protein